MGDWNIAEWVDVLVHEAVSGNDGDSAVLSRVNGFEVLDTVVTILGSEDLGLKVGLLNEG